MTPEERQQRLFALMERAVMDFEKLNRRHIVFMLREIERVRNELTDMLLQYADSDGTIKRNRIQQILRELDKIEVAMRETTLEGMKQVISESAQAAVDGAQTALTQSLGSAVVAGMKFDTISRDVLVYLSTRFSPDGLVLSDRIWQLTGEQRDALNNVIRSGILQGAGVTNLIAQVRRVYETDTWKIRRMVITEGNTAYRVATSFAARRSDIPMMLKIVDNPGHKNHERHRCSILARQDRYGKGAGVYKPTDTEIFNPHPNCTATLRYVIDEDWMKQRYSQQPQMPAEESKEAPPQDNQLTPDADPIATLGSIKNTKEAIAWAKRNVGDHIEYDFKDYDLSNALEMNRAMLTMKQHYPEMMERITYIGTIQEKNRRKYEHDIERLILHNIKVSSYWKQRIKDVGEEQARKELRDAIVRGKYVKREKTSSYTNAQAGYYTKPDGTRETFVLLNKIRAKDSQEFQRLKEQSAEQKWSAVGSRYGTLIHEFGHQVDYLLQDAGLATFADELWNEYRQRPLQWWHQNISEYGSTKRAEMFAELFSEYVVKGDEARSIAKQFGEMLEAAMAKYRAGGNN